MSVHRREKILEILREKGFVRLHDLEAEFPDYSSMTLRRDIEFLENVGEAQRVRGGAKYVGNSNGAEDIYEIREIKNKAAKEHIASVAAGYAETGCSIYLDSGTTGMMIAKLLPDTPYFILTSGPNVAVEIAKKFKPSVTLVGGLMNRVTLSVSGTQSLDFIKDFNIETAFVAASAFSEENGFTVGNSSECELKRAVVKKAKKVIMLCDSAKFGKSMPYTFAALDEVDVLITEKQPDEEILKAAKKSNTSVIW